jgi:hypothetical protein
MTAAEIDCLATNAYTEMAFQELARSDAATYVGLAELHALRALGQRDSEYVRSHVLDTLRLATVRLAQGEVEEAAVVASQAVEMSGDLTSSIVLDRLDEFQERLSPEHSAIPQVKTFRAQLNTYLGHRVEHGRS